MGRHDHRFDLTAVALVTVSVVLALGVAEGVTRLAVDLPAPRLDPQVRYDHHPVRRFTLRPDQTAFTLDAPVRVDERGFRVHGDALSTEAGSTVIALGDSFTFGLGVADEETWPAVLERHMPDVRVVNAGTVSYGVFQELDLLAEKGLPLKPRGVVHGLYWNDYMSNTAPDADTPPVVNADGYFVWDAYKPERGVRRIGAWITERSALAFIGKQVLKGVMNAPTELEEGVQSYERAYQALVAGEVDESEWTPIVDFYRELRRLGSVHGFETYVVVFPVIGIIERTERPSEHPYARFVRSALDSLDIPYVNGFELWEELGLGSELFLPYNRHLSAAGYEVIGRAAADRFRVAGSRQDDPK